MISFGVFLLTFSAFPHGAPRGEGAPIPRLADVPPLPGRFSVEAAYAAIPHRRTVFDFGRSPLAEPERSYVRLMFELIDRGVVLRVSAYQSFYYGYADREELLDGMSTLASFVETLVSPPKDLEGYHRYVLSALKDQRAFFAEWLEQGSGFGHRDGRTLAAHPRVRGSSQALHAAYGILMGRYGAAESPENRNALFDYHCALDFL
jgi:hypothetical protein